MRKIMDQKLTLGWREWGALPELGIPALKIKVDTGAKTSALHTFGVEPFVQDGIDFVRFWVHPLQRNTRVALECVARVKDERVVRDSGGHTELRYIIETLLTLGDKSWPIEMSLTSRDTMRFRMLLGRRAMVAHAVVDPVASYLMGRKDPRTVYVS